MEKNKYGWLFLVACMLLIGQMPGNVLADDLTLDKPVKVFEGGALYRSGRIPVLDLHGSWREMGRQYGNLMSAELKDLYRRAVDEYFIGQKGLSRAAMTRSAERLFVFYPRRFKEILLGMAETSGLSRDQQVLLNALELYGTMSGCSGIFAWDDYTGNGPLIVGRNYDWFDSYADFARTLTVTVFHPDSGVSAAMVTFAGVIYVTTAMNETGLFLELNNGLPSGGGLSYANRVPAIANLFGFLVDFENMKQLDAAFQTTRPDFTFIINTADSKSACAYEWPPFGVKRRNGDNDGLLVSTNHFTDPSWGIVLQQNTGFQSVLRRDNLLALGQKHRGKIDASVMKQILDTPMSEGGATWPLEGGIRTVYQIIAVPENRSFWIKVPGFQDWTPAPVNVLFTSDRTYEK